MRIFRDQQTASHQQQQQQQQENRYPAQAAGRGERESQAHAKTIAEKATTTSTQRTTTTRTRIVPRPTPRPSPAVQSSTISSHPRVVKGPFLFIVLQFSSSSPSTLLSASLNRHRRFPAVSAIDGTQDKQPPPSCSSTPALALLPRQITTNLNRASFNPSRRRLNHLVVDNIIRHTASRPRLLLLQSPSHALLPATDDVSRQSAPSCASPSSVIPRRAAAAASSLALGPFKSPA